jgi:cytochrome b involved in lipid metabolism
VHTVLTFGVHLKINTSSPSAANRPLLSPRAYKPSLTMSEELSYSDVSSHSTKKDLYVVIHDKVYNASSFVDEHP